MASSILWFVIAILSAAGEVGQLNVPAASNQLVEGISVNSDISMNATWAEGVVILPSSEDHLHLSGYWSYDRDLMWWQELPSSAPKAQKPE
jgi:hypothetical protein